MIHQRFAHFISFSDVEPPQLCAYVRRIGALRDSRFWAAQNSASRKSLRSIALFYVFLRSLRSPYADNARNVRGISVIVCENVAAIAFVDDFPLTISRHMTHVSRLLHLSIMVCQYSALVWRSFAYQWAAYIRVWAAIIHVQAAYTPRTLSAVGVCTAHLPRTYCVTYARRSHGDFFFNMFKIWWRTWRMLGAPRRLHIVRLANPKRKWRS